MEYSWPGNVRELEHTVEHGFILCKQSAITPEHLPFEFKTIVIQPSISHNNGEIDDPQIILQALERTDWNKVKAAQLLGISRRTIYRKIKEHNIIK